MANDVIGTMDDGRRMATAENQLHMVTWVTHVTLKGNHKIIFQSILIVIKIDIITKIPYQNTCKHNLYFIIKSSWLKVLDIFIFSVVVLNVCIY